MIVLVNSCIDVDCGSQKLIIGNANEKENFNAIVKYDDV